MLAFVAALLLTAITVSSACVAQTGAPLQFTIEQSHSAGTVQLRFKRERNGRSENNWDSSFPVADLAGLDVGALNSPGTRPIRFTVVREAGRIDCAGSGGNAMARGTCSMTSDAEFNRFLADRGMGRPSEEDTFGMIALGVRRELVDALVRANYPTPTVEKLIELTAVEATPAYISGLSAQGYRPKTLDELVQFAALKITPEYIGSFARAGYRNLPADELVELKALDITLEFIAGFERMGYGRLPVDTLVQLKALNITPEYARAVSQGDTLPSPDHLVQLKAVSDDLRKR
jgi:hypothetical protein